MVETKTKQYCQNQIIIDHIDFAKCLAWKFYKERRNVSIDREELESAAMLGLCDAARRFDPSRGHSFRTFSYFRIRGAMFDLLRKNYWPVRPIFTERELGEDAAERSDLNFETMPEREFTNEPLELADFPESLSDDGEAEQAPQELDQSPAISLDTCDPYIASNAPTPETLAMFQSTRRRMFDLMGELPESEREILELHYYQDSTFEQMSGHFQGFSKSWLCRLHHRALQHLQQHIALAGARQDLSQSDIHSVPVFG